MQPGCGALFGAGEYLITSWLNKTPVTFKDAAISAGKGAVSGVLMGGIGKTLQAGTKVAKTAVKSTNIAKNASYINKASGNVAPTLKNATFLSSTTRDPRAVSRIQSQLSGNINYGKLHNYGPNGKLSTRAINNQLVSAVKSNGASGARYTGGSKVSGAVSNNYGKALVSNKNPLPREIDLQFFATKRPVSRATYGQGFSRHDYNLKQGKRTLEAYEKYRISLGRIKDTGRSVNPKQIRYTQDSISSRFGNKVPLNDSIQGIKLGRISQNDFPAIRIFEKNGLTYSLDNRRLFVFKEAGVKSIKTVPATPAEIAKEAWKFTTKNNGISIRIRR